MATSKAPSLSANPSAFRVANDTLRAAFLVAASATRAASVSNTCTLRAPRLTRCSARFEVASPQTRTRRPSIKGSAYAASATLGRKREESVIFGARGYHVTPRGKVDWKRETSGLTAGRGDDAGASAVHGHRVTLDLFGGIQPQAGACQAQQHGVRRAQLLVR